MSNKILHNVSCVDYMYPCAVFVKQRLNLDITTEDLINMSGEPYDKCSESLNIGDILVWISYPEEPAFKHTHPLKIQDDTCLDVGIVTCRHLGIYEGNNIISDFIDRGHPSIRFMQLSEHPMPKQVIKYDTIKHLIK